jgi:hypothetical protein
MTIVLYEWGGKKMLKLRFSIFLPIKPPTNCPSEQRLNSLIFSDGGISFLFYRENLLIGAFSSFHCEFISSINLSFFALL